MRARVHVLASLAASLLACSDGSEKSAGPPPSAPAAAPAATPAAPVVPARGSVLEEARKRSLTKDDFTESVSNRDPFRSFLSSFATQKIQNKEHPILLEKFTIDELKLVGIVTGEIQP